MNSSQRDDIDYPYSPKPAAVLVQVRPKGPRTRLWSWRFVARWVLRMALVAAGMTIIAAVPAGIVASRGLQQAAAIDELENLGCRVDFLGEHLYAGFRGRMQNYLRDKFGDKRFGDVFLVHAVDLNAGADVGRICEICTRFDRLDTFAIANDHFRFEQIAQWSRLDNLEDLFIHSDDLTDDDLARIGRIPALTTLELGSRKVTSAGLRHLNAAPQLTTLIIHSAMIDGSGPSNEAGFPQLNSLVIHDQARLNDDGIIKLGPLPELTSVALEGTAAGDEAIIHMARGGKLLQASLINTKVTDKSLEALSNCSELVSLDLAGTQVTDAGVVLLARCPSLYFLDVSETKVTGKGLGKLSGQDLRLRMDKSDVSDEGLRELLQIPGLQSLSLCDTKITGAGLGKLPLPESLQMVDLSGTALNQAGFVALATSKVPNLSLSRTALDDRALMQFVATDDIASLDVTGTRVTASGVKALYEARKQRLSAAQRDETLAVSCDFPEAVEPYLPSIYGTPEIPDLSELQRILQTAN